MIFLSVPFVAMHEFNERNRQCLVKFHFVAASEFNETNRQCLVQFHLCLCLNVMRQVDDICFSSICGHA